jgi:hypothetical protein
LLCDLVGDKEENKKKEDDINHWRQLEASGWWIVIADAHEG